jgi:predicted ATP-grasp superfamily ATP-dependent carboligase
MPPTKTKPRRHFDTALSAYLESIQQKKVALLAAINQPSKEADKNYHAAADKEKEARRAYRKATKSLYAVTQKH